MKGSPVDSSAALKQVDQQNYYLDLVQMIKDCSFVCKERLLKFRIRMPLIEHVKSQTSRD